MEISDIEVSALHPERWGDDLDVVTAARVSFHKEGAWEEYTWIDPPTGETIESANEKGYPVRYVTQHKLSDKDAKLINYLAKHKHFSPFNHSFISVRVKAPIIVSRQLVKHEYMPYNEVSRRYVDDEPSFYLPSEWRKRADSVKQGSSDEVFKNEAHYEITYRMEQCITKCLDTYDYLLHTGVCPEQARMALPLNMNTEWIWSGTLRAFAKMLTLRLDKHTQYETRIVAEKIRALVEPVFPVSVKALLNND